MIIKWDPSLSVGVMSIDKEHQKLINMINALNDAMLQRQGKEMVEKVIKALIGYTKIHFSNEERLFEKHNYPETQSHIAEHRSFVKKVQEFKISYMSGNVGLSIDVMNFLSDWLRSHIKGTDQKYTAFFQERGEN